MKLPVTLRHSSDLHVFLSLALLWILILWIFHAVPSLDIRISAFFFDDAACRPGTAPEVCGRFGLNADPSIRALRWALYALPYMAATAVVAMIVLGSVAQRWRHRLQMRRLWLSMASLAIATGLITNLWLKGYSGRPRPVQTDLFGGPLAFAPAGSFMGACVRNCSFISGEASGAGWLICLLILVPQRFRLLVGPPLAAASVLTAFLRVAVGAHYASDAILGWLMSIIVFTGLLAIERQLTAGHAPAAAHGSSSGPVRTGHC